MNLGKVLLGTAIVFGNNISKGIFSTYNAITLDK